MQWQIMTTRWQCVDILSLTHYEGAEGFITSCLSSLPLQTNKHISEDREKPFCLASQIHLPESESQVALVFPVFKSSVLRLCCALWCRDLDFPVCSLQGQLGHLSNWDEWPPAPTDGQRLSRSQNFLPTPICQIHAANKSQPNTCCLLFS